MADISQVLQDRDGNTSSKRVVTLSAALVFFVIALADAFTGHHPSEYIVTNLMIVILGGLGVTAAEWFGKPKV